MSNEKEMIREIHSFEDGIMLGYCKETGDRGPSVLCVQRISLDKIETINMFYGEDADNIYNVLVREEM